jgi:hypothetical protein
LEHGVQLEAFLDGRVNGRIYGKGFPSVEDVELCRSFHTSTWERQLSET